VAFNLLSRMLELNPTKRISAKEAIEHAYFKEEHFPLKCLPEELPKIEIDSHEFQSRQNKQKQQQAGKPIIPNQPNVGNMPIRQKDRPDMIVGKHGYNNNPNYYNKVSSKQVESKLKFEESQTVTQQGIQVSSTTHSSRLEALITNSNPSGENTFLHNKRYLEPNKEDIESNNIKKPRNSPQNLK